MNKRTEVLAQIDHAFDKFNERSSAITSDTAAMYAYRWGYMETLVRELIFRASDEERDFICKSLSGRNRNELTCS